MTSHHNATKAVCVFECVCVNAHVCMRGVVSLHVLYSFANWRRKFPAFTLAQVCPIMMTEESIKNQNRACHNPPETHAHKHTHPTLFCNVICPERRDSPIVFLCTAAVLELMMQRGKREATAAAGRCGGQGGEGEGAQTDGEGGAVSGLRVVCEDLRPSVRGSVCVCVCLVRCVSAVELGFALLTPRAFPPVTEGKYIHTLKCTVSRCTPGCPGRSALGRCAHGVMSHRLGVRRPNFSKVAIAQKASVVACLLVSGGRRFYPQF